MNMEISADGAGKQEASEAQTPNFADSFRGSQTPKTHPQILPWMKNVWWCLPASLGLQARKQKARAGQACSSSQESRAQDLFLPTTPLFWVGNGHPVSTWMLLETGSPLPHKAMGFLSSTYRD